jgi:hypothetical protein
MRVLFCLMACLWVFSPLGAGAGTFTLWDYFPATTQGENSIYLAGYNEPLDTVFPLISDGDNSYSFSLNGSPPVVARSVAEPWIRLQPTTGIFAMLVGHPPEATSLDLMGEFKLETSGSATVYIGTGQDANPYHATYWLDQDLDAQQTSIGFNLSNILIDETTIIFFGVEGSPVLLSSAITATPVPLPGTLALLGSGLLGLAGWRRRSRPS